MFVLAVRMSAERPRQSRLARKLSFSDMRSLRKLKKKKKEVRVVVIVGVAVVVIFGVITFFIRNLVIP